GRHAAVRAVAHQRLVGARDRAARRRQDHPARGELHRPGKPPLGRPGETLMLGFLQRAFDFLAGRSGYRETYVSDPTRFIREYLRTHPEEIDSQADGRAIWWDKT